MGAVGKENLQVLAESRAGSIIEVDGQRFILSNISVELNHKHLIPRTPEDEATRLKMNLDAGLVDMICIEGSMKSGKSTTLAIFIKKYLEDGLTASYVRPANARPLDQENGLAEVAKLVTQPTTKEEFLNEIRASAAQFVAIDELNVAQFLPGDIIPRDFFESFLGIVTDKIENGHKVGIGLLDRQFNGKPFAPVEQLREFARKRRNVEFSHMQAACIGCLGKGQVSNRSVFLGKVYGAAVYKPVDLDAPIEGINDTYIPLCGSCFGKANKIEDVSEILGVTEIPVGQGFSLRDKTL